MKWIALRKVYSVLLHSGWSRARYAANR